MNTRLFFLPVLCILALPRKRVKQVPGNTSPSPLALPVLVPSELSSLRPLLEWMALNSNSD